MIKIIFTRRQVSVRLSRVIKGYMFAGKSCSALTRGELEDSALGIVVNSRLGRSVPGTAANLGRSVQVSLADHLNVECLDTIWTGGLSDLIGRLLKLDCRSWSNRRLEVTTVLLSLFTTISCKYATNNQQNQPNTVCHHGKLLLLCPSYPQSASRFGSWTSFKMLSTYSTSPGSDHQSP